MPKADALRGLDEPVIEDDADRPPKRYVDHWWVMLHSAVFFAAAVAVGLALLGFLKMGPCGTGTGETEKAAVAPPSFIMVAMLAGVLGGLIHAISSFTDFAGNRQLMSSWIPWLYLRAPIGGLLATVVYFVLAASALKGDCPGFYKVALSGALAGLFSKQVADKLSDLVENIFVVATPPVRHDALNHADAAATAANGTRAVDSPPTFDETVQKAQRALIALGYLITPSADGRAADGGVYDAATRAAIDQFLTSQGITDADRAQALGDDHAPDFWPRLLDLLQSVAQGRVAKAG